jgi:hypothetical protein
MTRRAAPPPPAARPGPPAARPPVAGAAPSSQPRARRRARLAISFWLVVGLVCWNVLFDREVKRGENDYVRLQSAHIGGKGPAVTVRGVMDAAIRHGVTVATGWTLLVLATGLAATWWAARKRRPSGPASRRRGPGGV